MTYRKFTDFGLGSSYWVLVYAKGALSNHILQGSGIRDYMALFRDAHGKAKRFSNVFLYFIVDQFCKDP